MALAQVLPRRCVRGIASSSADRTVSFAIIYLGYWLVILGVLLAYRTWMPLMLLIMTVPSFYRRARREEISLEENFGLEWQANATNVPMFLPRWKKKSKETDHW